MNISLQELVQRTCGRDIQFAQATTRSEQMALLDDLLAAWGATSGFGDMRCMVVANDANFNLFERSVA